MDQFFCNIAELVQPRLEVVERSDAAIDQAPAVQALDGRVWKVPLSAVEGQAMVDHARYPANTLGVRPSEPYVLSMKHALSPVRVSQPLIEHKNTQEINEIVDLAENGVR
jgi:hypothetical protein